MKSKNHYTISAIKRNSKGLTIYNASVPFPFAAQCFRTFDANLPPEQRSQRALDYRHASKIRNYMQTHSNYYLPPLIVAVSGDLEFSPFRQDGANGILKISMNAVYNILDGQHRTQAIRELIDDKETDRQFKEEQISVDFLVDVELAQAQNYFRLLNDTGKTVSKNLTLFYDDDPLTQEIHKILGQVPLFTDRLVEKEKTNLPAKSQKLFVYKWLHTATEKMIPNISEEFDTTYCVTFWTTLADIIEQWKQVFTEELSPQAVRENFICSHGIFIEALGELGKQLLVNNQDNPDAIKKYLSKLKNIDWSKDNPDWQNRVVDTNKKMLSRSGNRQFLVDYFLQMIKP